MTAWGFRNDARINPFIGRRASVGDACGMMRQPPGSTFGGAPRPAECPAARIESWRRESAAERVRAGDRRGAEDAGSERPRRLERREASRCVEIRSGPSPGEGALEGGPGPRAGASAAARRRGGDAVPAADRRLATRLTGPGCSGRGGTRSQADHPGAFRRSSVSDAHRSTRAEPFSREHIPIRGPVGVRRVSSYHPRRPRPSSIGLATGRRPPGGDRRAHVDRPAVAGLELIFNGPGPGLEGG